MAHRPQNSVVFYVGDDDSDEPGLVGVEQVEETVTIVNVIGGAVNLNDYAHPLRPGKPDYNLDYEDDLAAGWEKNPQNKPALSPFEGKSMLKASVNVEMNPIDFFSIFIDGEFLEHITKMTNNYSYF